MDVSELVCDFPSKVPWAELRTIAWDVASATDAGTLGSACQAAEEVGIHLNGPALPPNQQLNMKSTTTQSAMVIYPVSAHRS